MSASSPPTSSRASALLWRKPKPPAYPAQREGARSRNIAPSLRRAARSQTGRPLPSSGCFFSQARALRRSSALPGPTLTSNAGRSPCRRARAERGARTPFPPMRSTCWPSRRARKAVHGSSPLRWTPNRPLSLSVLENAWQALRARAGLQRMYHCTISVTPREHMFRKREPTHSPCGDFLRHKTLAMTGRYANRDADPIRQAAEAIGERLHRGLTRKLTDQDTGSPATNIG